MRKIGLQNLINIPLRALTLAGKFSVIFFMAKYLKPEDFSLYGLLAATIAYSLYIVSFEFSNYTTRELIAQPTSSWGKILKSHAYFILLLYIIFTPTIIYLFGANLLPDGYLYWFLLVLFLEHLFQETAKLLIADTLVFEANMVIFMGHGLWPILASICMVLLPDARVVSFVLSCWICGAALSCAFGLIFIKKLNLGGWDSPVRWDFIKAGIAIAFPLLLCTLALRGILTLDRYLVLSFHGKDILASYVLYVGVAAAMLSLLEASLFYPFYPRLIKCFKNGSIQQHRKMVKTFFSYCVVFVLVTSAIALLAMHTLVSFIDKDVYVDNLSMFRWILLAFCFYCLSMVPHYALYSQGKDKPLLFINLSAIVCFAVAIYFIRSLTENSTSLNTVPLGLVFSFFILFLMKSYAYIYLQSGSGFVRNG